MSDPPTDSVANLSITENDTSARPGTRQPKNKNKGKAKAEGNSAESQPQPKKNTGGGGSGGLKPNPSKSAKLRGMEKDAPEGEGLAMRKDGYVKVADLLDNPKLKALNLDLEAIKNLVRADAKKRYDLVLESPRGVKLEMFGAEPLVVPAVEVGVGAAAEGTAASSSEAAGDKKDGVWWIKANQGHSLKTVELELRPITSLKDIPTGVAVHGTNREAWKFISSEGLSKMKRNHIHLAQNVAGKNVVSGMRTSSHILIYIDVTKALDAGIKFWIRNNAMESLLGNLSKTGTTLENATTLRLPKRPRSQPLEDFAPTLCPGSSQRNGAYGAKGSSQSSTQSRIGNSKFKPALDTGSKHSGTRPSSKGTGGTTNKSTSGSSRPGTQEAKGSTVKKPQFRTFTGYVDADEEVSSSEDEMDLLSSQPGYSDDDCRVYRSSKSSEKTTSPKRGSSGNSWSAGFDAGTPRPKVGQNGKTKAEKKLTKEVDIDFTVETHYQHSHDPAILDQKSKNLQKLKISKVKKDAAGDPPASPSLPPSSSSTSLRRNKPPSKENSSSHARKEKPKFLDPPSRGRDDEAVALIAHTAASTISVIFEVNNKASSPWPKSLLGPQNPAPRPRAQRNTQTVTDLPSSQGSRSSFGQGGSQTRPALSMTDILDLSQSQGPSTSRRKSSQLQHRSRSRSRERSRELSPECEVRVVPQPFPNLSPTSSPSKPPCPAEFPLMSPLRESLEEEPRHKPKSSFARIPQAFPMSPPVSKDLQDDSGEKTRVKPSGTGKEKSLLSEEEDLPVVVKKRAGKGKEKEKDTRKAKGTIRVRKKLDPFPMSTQVLASIDSPSVPRARSPSGSTPPSKKRPSEDGSGDDRVSKKSRKYISELLRSPTRLPFEDEGDSITISPNVDPRTLCPYCDVPLPSSPSPLLLGILSDIKKKSTRDPRPSNPLGLKAPLAIFIAACQRHRFESQILPEAERKGWPKTIDWKRLGGRIGRMKSDLKALIEDPGEARKEGGDESEEEDDWDVVYSRDKGKKKVKSKKGAKERSIFWMEIMTEIKAKGLRAVAGVRGQFTNFEKAQPGYYGELGSVIIHQTLYNMFPPSEMEPHLIAPLTANEFVQRILVPEVALRLIMEDKNLDGEGGMQEALTILRDSSTYGVAMFPEDGGEWGGGGRKRGEADEEKMGVGDMIVMERARKRRKELEEEEEQERRASEAAKEREAAQEREKEARRKRRDRDRQEAASDVPSEPSKPPRPRPRPIAKGSSAMSVVAPRESEGDSKRRPMHITRSRSRSQSVASNRSHMDTDPASGIETSIEISDSDSDNAHRPTSEERRRSPSASESRPGPGSSKPSSTRSMSRGMERLGFESSGSNTSTKAVVDSKRMRSRSSSRVQMPKPQAREDTKMVVDDEDSDNDPVEFQRFTTPVSKRRGSSRQPTLEISSDEETPKAQPPRDVEDISPLRPLLRAKARSKGSQSSLIHFKQTHLGTTTASKPSRSSSKSSSTLEQKESYGWLLNAESSPSPPMRETTLTKR
ncbi:hypothetical protein NLJ89_g3827 [Agrocybe chaxingu]|uniref:2'-phosphotransferase n=1 Tax=Agrocybe chaxingu TaxID=84603 RepID=A0A9W8K511_9AGAR|nr:hypothetical protein NLJ89_g3827 [Agrocybe chaxingu]